MAEGITHQPEGSDHRRKTLDIISKHLRHELTKLHHKFSDKSSDGNEHGHGNEPSLKKHEQKLMRYLWKDVKRQNVSSLDSCLTTNAVKLYDLDPSGSLLMHATTYKMKETIRILLKHGSPVACNEHDNGRSPLHVAAKSGSTAVLAIMIDSKVSLKQVTLYEKKSALHIAIRNNRLGVAKMLLENDIDPNVKDIYGSTPLHYAVSLKQDRLHADFINTYRHVPSNCELTMKHNELVSLLVDHDGDINMSDNEGWTSLHYAVAADNTHIVKLLLNSKANMYAQTKYGKTALHLACSYKQLDIVGLLIDHDAPTDVIDWQGNQPINCTHNKDILTLLKISISGKESEPCEVKHIKMQIKSKSLIDLLEPELLNDTVITKGDNSLSKSLPSINQPSKNKYDLGNVVQLMIRTRQRKWGPDLLDEDSRCHSLDVTSEVVDIKSELYHIDEDVFQTASICHQEDTNSKHEVTVEIHKDEETSNSVISSDKSIQDLSIIQDSDSSLYSEETYVDSQASGTLNHTTDLLEINNNLSVHLPLVKKKLADESKQISKTNHHLSEERINNNFPRNTPLIRQFSVELSNENEDFSEWVNIEAEDCTNDVVVSDGQLETVKMQSVIVNNINTMTSCIDDVTKAVDTITCLDNENQKEQKLQELHMYLDMWKNDAENLKLNLRNKYLANS